MTSTQARDGASPGEIVRERLREARKQRKLNATQAAELFGDQAMSATVLMNIEAGRRQTGATVDELVRFAYVLGVPPEALLVRPGVDIEVAPGVVVDSARFLRWIRGQEAIGATDAAHYESVAAEILGGTDRPEPSRQLRDEFMSRAQTAFDGFFAYGDELEQRTRQQVREAFGDLRSAVAGGASTTELLAKIDGFLNRLG